MDHAVGGFPAGIPDRIDAADLPVGPDGTAFRVEGGARPGSEGVAEFVVVPSDTGATGDAALRSAWLSWLERCVAALGSGWNGEETDLEAARRMPASKAVGEFPLEAYIREEEGAAGLRYVHGGSGAMIEAITDPTVIASRAAASGYEGPPVILLLRISAAQ
jgi:hypothetical protein